MTEEYNDFINRYHGIKVVRDGFLVQGFGEGDGGDWLGYHLLPKQLESIFDLRNASVIGCVYLTGINNAVLKETTKEKDLLQIIIIEILRKFWTNPFVD